MDKFHTTRCSKCIARHRNSGNKDFLNDLTKKAEQGIKLDKLLKVHISGSTEEINGVLRELKTIPKSIDGYETKQNADFEKSIKEKAFLLGLNQNNIMI